MNIKTILVAGFAVSALVTFSQQPAPAGIPRPGQGANGEQLTPEQRAERARRFREMRYRNTGGFLPRPGSQNGCVVFVNGQSAAPNEWLQEIADTFAKELKFKVEVANGEFSFPNPEVAGNASVFVVDDPTLPPILSAPESKWAMVNVAPLKNGRGEKPAFFRARCMKELTRGFCLVAGTQDSNYPNALVGCILKPEDLDNHADWRLPVDVLARMKKYSSSFGVTPLEEVSYKTAVQEGWAPQPTNDVQQAIWDKVHQIPANPMKIEFDPKKGR